ncbi:hypothetical protein BHE74_00058731 [Ensete ventricosum]|nr:hypothetical protein GW17_00002775 [Ensete ventricosum]RWW36259.1 hypothetical protein BHE74_00058731 [Ensete ventricosum]
MQLGACREFDIGQRFGRCDRELVESLTLGRGSDNVVESSLRDRLIDRLSGAHRKFTGRMPGVRRKKIRSLPRVHRKDVGLHRKID